jgi:ParB family chromosome partitioning protein
MPDEPAAATQTPAASRRRRFTVDALFVDHRPQAVGVTDLASAKEIRLERIVPDPTQPRRSFDPGRLEELAASIRLEGVLQPIVVRYDAGSDVYVVVHGERRLRASRLVGLETIPAIVREVPEERRLAQQLMENVVREDLNAVDRAAALRGLKAQLGDAPWEQVAEAVGIRRSRLFQLLGTEKLSERAREDIRTGRLSEKQSRALQGLAPGPQEALRALIVAEELPADEALRLARGLRSVELPADDAGAAAVLLADLRATVPEAKQRRDETAVVADRGGDDAPPVRPATVDRAGDPTAELLAALADAVDGGPTSRAALARAADHAGAPPYDVDRLRAEILALARTLARAPAADLRPGGGAYAHLTALWGALDALLSRG